MLWAAAAPPFDAFGAAAALPAKSCWPPPLPPPAGTDSSKRQNPNSPARNKHASDANQIAPLADRLMKAESDAAIGDDYRLRCEKIPAELEHTKSKHTLHTTTRRR